MLFRSRKKIAREVSLNEPIGTDKEGNEISLIDVIEGHDRYASEILRYRFDVRELEERKEDAVCTTV